MRHYNFKLSDIKSKEIISVLTDVLYEKKVRLLECEEGDYPDIIDGDSVDVLIHYTRKDIKTLEDLIGVLDSTYRNDIQEKITQFEMNNDD